MFTKIFFLLIFLLSIISSNIFAQEPNRNLIREIEDQVAANPDDPFRLAKKGDIYSDIARIPENYTEEFKGAVYTSYDAYKKALELSNNESKQAKDGLKILHPIAINVGTTAYQTGNIDDALKAFELAQEITPLDTLPYMYSIRIVKDFDPNDKTNQTFTVNNQEKYEQNMEKLLTMPFNAKLEYMEEYVTYFASPSDHQDYDKALEWAEIASEEFPQHRRFQEIKIIIYIIKEDDIKVEQNIADQKRRLENNPDFEEYYNFGVANELVARAYEEVARDTVWGDYSQMERVLKMDIAMSYYNDAQASYETSLEMKFDEPNTIYNLASIHYNHGARVNDSINVKIASRKFKKKEIVRMRNRRNEHFINALPYFEDIRENYQDVIRAREKKYIVEQLEAMRTIYRELDKREDREKYLSVLNELVEVYRAEQIKEKKDREEELIGIQKELEKLE